MLKSMLMSALATSLFTGVVVAGDRDLAWPQFRGPGGSGIADHQKPPVEFGPNKNLKWKVKTPSGFSSPIVVGDLLVLTAFENQKLYTIAYHRADGKEAWRAAAPAKQIERYHLTMGSPAAPTPATDGHVIVSYFGSCGLLAYHLTGKQLWKFELPVASLPGDFGSGVSPVIADGLVLLVRDETTTSKIYALEIATGHVRWEKERASKSSFCSPVVCDTPTGKQLVAAGYGKMIAYDVANGAEKWFVSGMPAVSCATPVVSGDIVYFAGWSPGEDFKLPPFDMLIKETGEEKQGYITQPGLEKTFMKGMFNSQDTDHDGKLTRAEWDAQLKFLAASKNSAFAVKLGGSGDVTKTHVVWRQTKGLPYVPSGIVSDGLYLLVKDGGLITAYDTKTGKGVYVQKRAAATGGYYASPIAANGLIYLTALQDGSITVLKVGGPEPEVMARNPPLDERVAATPAIANDTLYVRTDGHLYAFAEKK